MKSRRFVRPRFFGLLSVLQFVGVLGIADSMFFGIYAGLAVLAAYFLWREFKSLISAETVFETKFHLPQILELDKEAVIAFELEVRTSKSFDSRKMEFCFPELRLMKLLSRTFEVKKVPRSPSFLVRGQFKVVPTKLGTEAPDSFELYFDSSLGFFQRSFQVPFLNLKYRVMPQTKPVSEEKFQQVVRQQKLLYQGSRRLLRSQAPELFYSIRDYQYPDPMRFYDPRKSAKFQKPMTRTFESYYEHHVILALDIGRSMSGRLGESSKLDFYLSAALHLAASALKSRDRVSFFAFHQEPEFLIRGARNFSSFQGLQSGSLELQPRMKESNYELILPLAQSCSPTRAILILLADTSRASVQKGLVKSLRSLDSKYLSVIASLEDEKYSLEGSFAEGNSRELDHVNRVLFQYKLLEERLHFQNQVNQYSSAVVSAHHKEWISVVGRVYETLRNSTKI
jgi:uncharacterized protein (DUF58 family)